MTKHEYSGNNPSFKDSENNIQNIQRSYENTEGKLHLLDIPMSVKRIAHLNGNVRGIIPLATGASGVNVAEIITDQRSLVAKWSEEHKHKVGREIRGRKLLEDTPLGAWLVPTIESSEEDGVLIMPKFDGTELRQGLQTGKVNLSLAKETLNELLNTKLNWWSEQNKKTPTEGFVSMQREEWQDTLQGIEATLTQIGEKYNISRYDLVTLPIIYRDQEFPSLAYAIKKAHQNLQSEPPYTTLAHNDATGGNILVNMETGEKALLDGEWAGQSDPAEAFTRVGKYISATTIEQMTQPIIEARPSGIHIQTEVAVPKEAIVLQNLVLSKAEEFGKALKDEDFTSRFGNYSASSYLREVALARKRGLDKGIFSIIKAVDMASMQ